MTSIEWIEISKNLAWPFVGLLALAYVWRSDAINKLIKISDSVKELRGRLRDLVEAEEKLGQSLGALSDMTATMSQLHSDLQLMKADVENIRDRVDLPGEQAQHPTLVTAVDKVQLDNRFSEIDIAWQKLSDALQTKFGMFDGRKTGSEAYRFAHGNRKGIRLSYDQADEIARLHSSIKSYRRRQSSLEDWLTQEIRDEFFTACTKITDQINAL